MLSYCRAKISIIFLYLSFGNSWKRSSWLTCEFRFPVSLEYSTLYKRYILQIQGECLITILENIKKKFQKDVIQREA